jgi:hypothetical protein
MFSDRIRNGFKFVEGKLYNNVIRDGDVEFMVIPYDRGFKKFLRVIIPDPDGFTAKDKIKDPYYALQWIKS